MDFQILFDKNTVSSNFKSGWGFSLFVDGVLFDTGEEGSNLIYNLKEKKIDINSIEKVILSHNHWDHTGGLWSVLKIKKNLQIYGCSDFQQEFKDKVKKLGSEFIQAEGLIQVKKNIYTTGEIAGFYKSKVIFEQALIIKSKNGLIIGVGCSHPGIIKIIEKIKEFFPEQELDLLVGGFHLMEKENREIKLIAQNLKNMGIKKIAPAHCTGYEAVGVFKEIFRQECVLIKAGETFTT